MCICAREDNIYITHATDSDQRIGRIFIKTPYSGKVFKYFKNKSYDPKFIGELKSSLRNGIWSDWWQNGKIKYKGRYKLGKKTGVWREWDMNGVLRFESIFLNGKPLQIKNCMTDKCDSIFYIKTNKPPLYFKK